MVIGIFLALGVLAFVMAVLILAGRGDFLISDLRGSGAQKYNVRRVRLLNAVLLFVSIVFLVALHFAMSSPNAVKTIRILVGGMIVLAVIQQILTYTWAKRK